MSEQLPEVLRRAMLAFAQAVMVERKPDFILGGYMERWHLRGRGGESNAYIHRFSGSDSDRALHDHPYDNVTCVLDGSYDEHFHEEPLRLVGDRYATKALHRRQGSVIERTAQTLHRVAVPDGATVTTLFFTGARIRTWGFLTPTDGWIEWTKYENAYATEIARDQAARQRAPSDGGGTGLVQWTGNLGPGMTVVIPKAEKVPDAK